MFKKMHYYFAIYIGIVVTDDWVFSFDSYYQNIVASCMHFHCGFAARKYKVGFKKILILPLYNFAILLFNAKCFGFRITGQIRSTISESESIIEITPIDVATI